MKSVAEQLREGREQRGWTVAEVVSRTNLKADQVRSLEAGKWDAFAAPVYIRGFVRSYALQLRLPLEELNRQLEEELGQPPRLADLTATPPPARTTVNQLLLGFSRVNWRIALPVLAFMAVVAATYFAAQAWQNRRPADSLGQLGPGLVDLDRKSADVDHLPPAPVPGLLPR